MYEISNLWNCLKRYNRPHFKFNTTLHIFPDGLRIVRYLEHVESSVSGFEDSRDTSKDKYVRDTGVTRNDSLVRTRNLVSDLVRANPIWKSFITLTFRENISDRDMAYKFLKSYLKIVKLHFPDLAYICVPERQKRGAIHYHLLTNIPCDSELIPKRSVKKIFNHKKCKYYDMQYYDLPYWSHGYSLVFDCVNDVDENFSFEKYVCKYMTKDLFDPDAFGRVKVLHSRNLAKPVKVNCNFDSLDFVDMLDMLGVDYHNKKTVNSKCIYCPDYNIYNIKF